MPLGLPLTRSYKEIEKIIEEDSRPDLDTTMHVLFILFEKNLAENPSEYEHVLFKVWHYKRSLSKWIEIPKKMKTNEKRETS